jgi:prepilin-type N-terminal cleavage/methylation domain-containing protein
MMAGRQAGACASERGTILASKRHRECGLTLIEVVVALLVMTIGALAVARLIPQSVAVTSQARRQTLAMQAAQAKMEQILTLPYESVASENMAYVSNDPHSEYRLIQRRVQVRYVRPDDGWKNIGADKGMKQVEITAQWREGSYTRQITLVTLVADR